LGGKPGKLEPLGAKNMASFAIVGRTVAASKKVTVWGSSLANVQVTLSPL